MIRAPGPYRQVFVSDATHIPMARFELKLDDLNQRLDSPGPIAATWELLQDYRRSGGNTSVEIAIESFNRSYGFQLRPPSRAANLFTALDAMLGGMSAWKIGRVPVSYCVPTMKELLGHKDVKNDNDSYPSSDRVATGVRSPADALGPTGSSKVMRNPPNIRGKTTPGTQRAGAQRVVSEPARYGGSCTGELPPKGSYAKTI